MFPLKIKFTFNLTNAEVNKNLRTVLKHILINEGFPSVSWRKRKGVNC